MDTEHSSCCGAERCVTNFIQQIWNEGQFERIDNYLHDKYVDYSMPNNCFQNKTGMMLYMQELGKRVHHQTQILKLTSMKDFIFCQVRIRVIGIAALSQDQPIEIDGYRLFEMSDEKIIAHWEMI